ncbi:hypothetical protein O9992_30645 [Vibrio lentus]|nr:hypothetical protein [Vibrio lentus]
MRGYGDMGISLVGDYQWSASFTKCKENGEDTDSEDAEQKYSLVIALNM